MQETERKLSRVDAKHRKEDERYDREAISDLLATYHGRRFLWMQLAQSNIFNTPYTGNALSTAYNCGVHNAGLRLLNLITEVDAGAYSLLIKENADVLKRRNFEATQAAAET